MSLFNYKYVIFCILLISFIWAQTNQQFNNINQQIDVLTYKILGYEFDYSYKEIDSLIDECRKMSYKSQFKPAERFISDVWQLKL